MQDELLQFKLQKVWTLVNLPYGKRAIDYDEVFAPVARIEAIRLFLAYASFMNFIVYQMDVKSAFLYGTIEEEVYVCQPPGFEDLEFPNKVYKVEKALYGLHQAPRAWYETLSTYLLENRFRRGTIDKTLFIKKDKDDILLVQVKPKDDGIFISQDTYVANILKKFDFATVKTTSTPMETNKALLKDEEAADVDVHLYISMIGSLMYLTTSRPDIMFVVCACARFQVTQKTSHLHAMNRIFRYLKGNPQHEVVNFLEEDETVIKEWEDKMEKAATTAFSLEAEQDSGSGPRCQDTILGVQKLKFDLRLHLNKSYDPPLSRVNTLGSGEDNMKLKELMEFCTKLSVKIVNGEVQIQALVDGKKVIVTEISVIRALQLKDAEALFHLNGNSYPLQFSNALVLRLLLGTKLVALWPQLSSCLATNQNFNFSKYIFDNIVKNLEGGVKFLMYPRMVQALEELEPITDEAANEEHVPTHSNDPLLSGEDRLKLNELMELCTNLSQRVLDLENTKTSQAAEITKLKERVKKLERRNKSRTLGLKRLRKVGRSAQVVSSEDEGLGAQEDASKQGRKIADLDADAEVTLVDEAQGRNDDNLMFDTGVFDEQEVEVEKVVSTAEVTTVSATTTTVDELTLAQTLIEIKAAKPKVVTTAATTTTTAVTRPKARGVKLAKQREEDANVAEYDNVQAMIDADYELAIRLQAQEQEELTVEEKSKLFVELMDKRKKHFARLRAEEQRRKPPTKAQKRNQMCTYLKNMAGFTHSQLKNKSFDEVQKAFDKTIGWIDSFVSMDSEVVKGDKEKDEGSVTRAEESSSKRAGTELEQERIKKQKIDDDQEEAEMKKHMEIVVDEEEIAVDAIPLATKPPIIKLVKAKHGNTRPEEAYERVLWGDLKVMFEPDVESEVWRNLQGYNVTVWKLFSSSGVKTFNEETEIQKKNIKFRGGLLGLKAS
ncbi:uncharacterized mitochondrial protein-like protein [Tanacetum coccineum]